MTAKQLDQTKRAIRRSVEAGEVYLYLRGLMLACDESVDVPFICRVRP